MDHRKNFVKAMKVVAELDGLLAQMDGLFREYHRLVIARAKQEVDSKAFATQVKELANKRQQLLIKYSLAGKKIQEIKNEYGGEVKE